MANFIGVRFSNDQLRAEGGAPLYDGIVCVTWSDGEKRNQLWLKDGEVIPPRQDILERLRRAEDEEVRRLNAPRPPSWGSRLVNRVKAALT